MRFLVPALVLVLLTAASFAAAQDRPDLPPILKRAVDAFPKLRYSGTRVVEFRRGPDRQTHREVVIRDGDRTRVEFPAESRFAGQIIIEVGGRRMHYFPDLKEVHTMPARREEAFERIFRFLKPRRGGPPFKVTQAPGEMVAGLRTEQAVVTDPNGGVHQRIYIEPRSGMILKREMFDRVGTPIGSYEFTRVDLTPNIDSREFKPTFPKGTKWVTPYDLARRLAKEQGFLPMTLKPDRKLQLEHARVFKIGDVPVLAEMYIAGERRFSLFQVKGGIEPDRLRQLARGGLTAHAWSLRGSTFVLVGEVDKAELERLAKRLTDR